MKRDRHTLRLAHPHLNRYDREPPPGARRTEGARISPSALRLWLTLAAALVGILVSTPLAALAEPPAGPRDEPLRYDFDDGDQVFGDLRSPKGDLLLVRRGKGRQSLIRVREQFVTELVRSAGTL
jgi:hypothetical protein